MQVRLKDIADKLGVSTMTVSRALRATSGDVNSQTRERIRKVALEMGYRVNGSARAMRVGRYDSLALFCTSHYAYGSRCFIDCMSRKLEEKSNQLVISPVMDGMDLDTDILSSQMSRLSVDGLLIDVHQEDVHALRSTVDKHKLPHVWLNVRQKEDSVYIDELDVGERLTRHLISRGHTRIVFATLDTGFRVMHAPDDREAGYGKAMHEAGLRPIFWELPDWGADSCCLYSSLVERSVSNRFCEDEPTAIVAYDLQAAGPIVSALKSSGLRIPEHVEVVSFHDEIFTPLGDSLVVAQLPIDRLVDSAVDMLWEKIGEGLRNCESIPVLYDLDGFEERLNRVFGTV